MALDERPFDERAFTFLAVLAGIFGIITGIVILIAAVEGRLRPGLSLWDGFKGGFLCVVIGCAVAYAPRLIYWK